MELDGIFVLTLFMAGFFSVIFVGLDSNESQPFLGELSGQVKKSSRVQLWENLTERSRFILGFAAVVLFAAALGVNISTWFSNGIVRHRNLLIAVDIGMGFLIFAWVVLERWRWRMFGPKERTFIFPRWSKAVLAALFVYIGSGFAFDGWHSYRQQKLSNPNGEIKLEMTSAEQMQKQTRIIRGFAGVWILLSSVSATALLFMKSEPYKGPFGKFNRVVEQL